MTPEKGKMREKSRLQTHPQGTGLLSHAPKHHHPGPPLSSLPSAGYYFEIPSIGAIRINTQVRLVGQPSFAAPYLCLAGTLERWAAV